MSSGDGHYHERSSREEMKRYQITNPDRGTVLHSAHACWIRAKIKFGTWFWRTMAWAVRGRLYLLNENPTQERQMMQLPLPQCVKPHDPLLLVKWNWLVLKYQPHAHNPQESALNLLKTLDMPKLVEWPHNTPKFQNLSYKCSRLTSSHLHLQVLICSLKFWWASLMHGLPC